MDTSIQLNVLFTRFSHHRWANKLCC